MLCWHSFGKNECTFKKNEHAFEKNECLLKKNKCPFKKEWMSVQKEQSAFKKYECYFEIGQTCVFKKNDLTLVCVSIRTCSFDNLPCSSAFFDKCRQTCSNVIQKSMSSHWLSQILHYISTTETILLCVKLTEWSSSFFKRQMKWTGSFIGLNNTICWQHWLCITHLLLF